MKIREIKRWDELVKIYPLLRQLNNTITKREFTALLKEMLTRGYRCVVAEEKGKYVGMAGFWVGCRFWCRRHIDMDNVVVDEKCRESGVGKKIVAWIEAEARRMGCTLVGLDCYSHATRAHKFYHREGYIIRGYHFTKDMKGS